MKSYSEQKRRKPDFAVRYRLISQADGGRRRTFQHLRCDFMYEGDKPEQGIYCIHPEFLDSNNIPVEENIEIDLEGRATMWILFNEMRDFHRKKISEGTRGYFMEGSRKIGSLVVEEILGLNDDFSN